MAKDIKTYYEQSYIDNTLRLREVLQTLPSFAKDYFRAVEPTTSAKTKMCIRDRINIDYSHFFTCHRFNTATNTLCSHTRAFCSNEWEVVWSAFSSTVNLYRTLSLIHISK